MGVQSDPSLRRQVPRGHEFLCRTPSLGWRHPACEIPQPKADTQTDSQTSERKLLGPYIASSERGRRSARYQILCVCWTVHCFHPVLMSYPNGWVCLPRKLALESLRPIDFAMDTRKEWRDTYYFQYVNNARSFQVGSGSRHFQTRAHERSVNPLTIANVTGNLMFVKSASDNLKPCI